MNTYKNKYIIYMLPVRCFMFILIFVLGAMITRRKIEDISNWWSIVASIVNIITILMIFFLIKKNKSNYWELINYQKGKTEVRQIIRISAFMLLIGMSGMYMAGYVCYGIIPYAAPMLIAPIPLWLSIMNMIVMPISTAFAEEGLYLGCGVNQIKNKYMAIMIPAFFFALQHSFIPMLFDIKYMIYRFLSFLPLTIILCRYYYKKRNPLPIMIGHTMIDVATAIQIFLTSLIPGLYEKICAM